MGIEIALLVGRMTETGIATGIVIEAMIDTEATIETETETETETATETETGIATLTAHRKRREKRNLNLLRRLGPGKQ